MIWKVGPTIDRPGGIRNYVIQSEENPDRPFIAEVYGGAGNLDRAKLIAEAPAMRDLLARIVNEIPFYNDPDEGAVCTFCGSQTIGTHDEGCDWVEAGEILARLDAVEGGK